MFTEKQWTIYYNIRGRNYIQLGTNYVQQLIELSIKALYLCYLMCSSSFVQFCCTRIEKGRMNSFWIKNIKYHEGRSQLSLIQNNHIYKIFMQQSEGISITIKRDYSLQQRFLCVPCLRQCTHTSNFELTREQRNKRKRIMLTKDQPSSSFSIDIDDQAIDVLSDLHTIDLLKELYSNEDEHYKHLVFQALRKKRLNPVIKKDAQRDDLEFYIPQLITYLAFQHDLCDYELIELIIRGCQVHFVFSHFCYFYLKSIAIVNGFPVPEINTFIKETFLPPMEIYKNHILTGLELARSDKNLKIQKKTPTLNEIDASQKYGTIDEDQIHIQFVRNLDIKNFAEDGYMSTPKFWEEMIRIGHDITNSSPRIVGLRKELREMNKRLPAAVYLPFLKFRNYVVLNINVETARIFATKERSPYSICLQLIREEQEYAKDQTDLKMLKKTSRAITVDKNQNSLKLQMRQTMSMQQADFRTSMEKTKSIIEQSNKEHILPRYQHIQSESLGMTKITEEKQIGHNGTQTLEKSRDSYSEVSISQDLDKSPLPTLEIENQSQSSSIKIIDKYFDIPFKDIQNGIRSKSIYKHFKTWKFVNIMVKTGDNLKQQQFAMQLINQFNIIFQKQNTGLLLRPYEVISITPDSGIMEMVTDTCSLGRVIKIMAHEGILTLMQFFKSYFKSRCKEAQKNFCRSLAAYSVVTYFLQIKDRHNDNILLHRDGYIVHIDFGFFLSNTPGKGLQLQKNCPFKLMSAYVDVLGGQNSLLFMEFRSLFQKGFKAAMQHKQQIYMLVKMMYSSHGQSMPCFKKGEECISEMIKRFQPKTEDITMHCQNLINQSLDNWRARWYDKFQYWLQGIFY